MRPLVLNAQYIQMYGLSIPSMRSYRQLTVNAHVFDVAMPMSAYTEAYGTTASSEFCYHLPSLHQSTIPKLYVYSVPQLAYSPSSAPPTNTSTAMPQTHKMLCHYKSCGLVLRTT